MNRVKLFYYPVICIGLACLPIEKKTLQQGSALSGETDNTATTVLALSSPAADTIIIERDTAAIDVKAAEIAPEILEPLKPVYSMEMIENQVEGSVRLKILVGSNGSVKEYIMFNDLGHGTDKAIHTALLKTRFTAARKENKRISVWIETTINFRPPKM